VTAVPRAETRSAAALASRTVSVQLHVRPYAQRALLDGVEVAHGEQRVTFSFSSASPHRIQVEHACCFPFVREFAAGEVIPQPLELKVPLRPRPARLRVDAEPSTRIYVDGKLVGTAAESQRSALEIPVPPGGDTPYEAQGKLVLERDGAPPIAATLRIRAGADVAFAAAPVPTPAPVIGEPAAEPATREGSSATADREEAP
jgi:serine/threonine-protein kinase